MTPDNLPNGFVQVKIIAPTVFGYTPTYADLEPYDQGSWTADTQQYQGVASCMSASASLVEVRSVSLMFDNGRYYNPVTVVRNLGNNNAPVVELAIDDAMRDSFEVRVTCVTTETAYEYSTTADLSTTGTGTGTVEGTLEVVEFGTKGDLVLSPCPANSEVILNDPSQPGVTVEFFDQVQSGDEVLVTFDVAFSDPNRSPIELFFKMTCYVDGPPRVAVGGTGSAEFRPSASGDNAQSDVSPETVAAVPVIGTVTMTNANVQVPRVIPILTIYQLTPTAPCPDGTDKVTWYPADAEAFTNDLDSGTIDLEKLLPSPYDGMGFTATDGLWSVTFNTSPGALSGIETWEVELYFICITDSPESVLARYEAVTLRFVEPGGEVTTQDSEPDGEVTTQDSQPDGEATGSGTPGPNPSSDPTPRFEVVPAPAPSSSGGTGSSPDSGDDDAETTGDDSVADAVRAFDFDIERQAIVDTATGAAVGVFDPETGNFVSPDDGSLIAVTDPSNGQVTVLATGDVVARILGSSTDEASDDENDDNDGDGSSSNTLAYILIGAAGVLLLLLGAFWLGNRGRARATAPPTVTPSSAAPSPVPPQEPAVPSAPEPTSPLPPPPPPATPDVSPSTDPDATPPGGTPTT